MSVVKVVDGRIPGMLIECGNGINAGPTLGLIGDVPFYAVLSNTCLKSALENLYLQEKANSDCNNVSSSHQKESGSGLSRENSASDAIPSRTLKDAFHLMQMVNVSLKHGMAKDFKRRFRDALFIVDPDDKKKVEEYLESISTDWKTKLLVDPEYIFKRVKRYIPPPNELYPMVEMVFKKYGIFICVDSVKPLFTDDSWKAAKAVFEETCL